MTSRWSLLLGLPGGMSGTTDACPPVRSLSAPPYILSEWQYLFGEETRLTDKPHRL